MNSETPIYVKLHEEQAAAAKAPASFKDRLNAALLTDRTSYSIGGKFGIPARTVRNFRKAVKRNERSINQQA